MSETAAMTIVRRPTVLPRLSLIKLWEWAGYPPHPVVGVNEYWQTDAAEQRLEREIHADLQRRGLGDGQRMSAELHGTITVLARATAECYAWVSDVRAGQNGGVLVAELDGRAVRLVRDDTAVRIDPVAAGELAEYLVMALPGVPPAAIEPITVEQSATRDDQPYQVQLKRAGAPPSDKARLNALTRAPHTGVHELYAAVRTARGESTSDALTVLDVAEVGRVLVTTSTTDRGEQRITCVPGTFTNLVGTLRRVAAAAAVQ